MTKTENTNIYIILQCKNISSELTKGIKASTQLHDIIEIEPYTYLLVKQITNNKYRNSIAIGTIQKVYDLLINKGVKIYIVDVLDASNTLTVDKDTNKTVSLDELYLTLDFKYVSKTIVKSGSLYFVVSYIQPEQDTQTTHIFPTSLVSKELFERSHILNNHAMQGTSLEFGEAQESKKSDAQIDCAQCKNAQDTIKKLKQEIQDLKNLHLQETKNLKIPDNNLSSTQLIQEVKNKYIKEIQELKNKHAQEIKALKEQALLNAQNIQNLQSLSKTNTSRNYYDSDNIYEDADNNYKDQNFAPKNKTTINENKQFIVKQNIYTNIWNSYIFHEPESRAESVKMILITMATYGLGLFYHHRLIIKFFMLK